MKTVMPLYVVMRTNYGTTYATRIFDSREAAQKFGESLTRMGIEGSFRIEVVTAEFGGGEEPKRPCATCGKLGHKPQDHAGWNPNDD